MCQVLLSQYYMAASAKRNGDVYISIPRERKIYKLRSTSFKHRTPSSADLTQNYQIVAGTGRTCYPLQKGKQQIYIDIH